MLVILETLTTCGLNSYSEKSSVEEQSENTIMDDNQSQKTDAGREGSIRYPKMVSKKGIAGGIEIIPLDAT